MKKIEAILALFKRRVVTIIQPDGRYRAHLVNERQVRYGRTVLHLDIKDIVALTIRPDDKLTIQTKVNLKGKLEGETTIWTSQK